MLRTGRYDRYLSGLVLQENNTLLPIEREIARQGLPADFIATVSDYYQPLAQDIIMRMGGQTQPTPHTIGIQGTQGSGKSTCASFLKTIFETQYDKRTLVLSIDDFYLTRAERKALAGSEHPLFATRGVPGTHDITLLEDTLDSCARIKSGVPVRVPTFDKAIDDRAKPSDWQIVSEAVDIIIIEGWCVGIPPQDENTLRQAINQLEAEEDGEHTWRNYVNRKLAGEYADLFKKFDHLVALQAPDFDCVFEWRLLQERKLAANLKQSGESLAASKVQSPAELRRFISHYERLTRHALDVMPKIADWMLILNTDHSFSALKTQVKKTSA